MEGILACSLEEFAILKTPVGWLKITANAIGITAITFLSEAPRSMMSLTLPHLKEAYRQLAEYFRGERLLFKLPLDPDGSEFERLVWSALAEVPFGTTISDSELASRLGHPEATRDVGLARQHNPLAIVVPSHRVVATASSDQPSAAPSSALGSINLRLLQMEGALN